MSILDWADLYPISNIYLSFIFAPRHSSYIIFPLVYGLPEFHLWKCKMFQKRRWRKASQQCHQHRSSHRRCYVRESVFLSAVFSTACNFIKKETLAQVFSCQFCEIFKNTYFIEHLWMAASVNIVLMCLCCVFVELYVYVLCTRC